jgi:hypothetical protein
MRILVCGEGDHDIGRTDWDERRRRYVSQEGWLQILIRKLLPTNRLEFLVKRRAELSRQSVAGKRRKLPKRHGEKAYFAMLVAQVEACDIVVFMVDADSNDVRDWRRICSEIHMGYEAAQRPVQGVACVPMSASECWLLSDANAWVQLGHTRPVELPGSPERLWGTREDPESNHPKNSFRRACGRTNVKDNSMTRWRIARESDVVVIERKCPTSFGDFGGEIC